ncbi:MAG TPA: sigma-54 dependent transcriptional regulator [Candidatus Saccharimonadia bacterium]|nr:sigma-54 dependent transcriptional regulator [Candidatus Saccharimonadia bacterium]
MATPLPILIADDQRDVLEALRLMLKSEGIPAVTVTSPDAALEQARTREFSCVLIDLNYTRDTTSGHEGLDLLAKLRAIDADLPVVVMTAWGTIDVAVRAIQAGAGDFIEKPWDNKRLMSVLRNQVALGQSRRRGLRLEREVEILRGVDDEFVAESRAMQPVLELIRRVGPSDANVLVLGENGTGKGVIAKLLHVNSRRADSAFVKINMGGIAESVFESEMFGHVKGAYTDAKADRIGRFEVADGGTLFLDEIGNIPVSQQPKLLRVLEDGELERLGSSKTIKVDVRIISATNAELAADVARGSFRKDLLFRLNTVEIRIPPLRDRREDIIPMATRFLARCGMRYGKPSLRFSPSAERALLAYAWPGNVRELSHVVERAVLMAPVDVVDTLEFSLPDATRGSGPAESDAETGESLTLDAAEERMVRRALERSEGNIQRAAEVLGLSRAALYRRLEKFGIRAPE